ncbi:hypothetical protein CB0940_10882 [Cercospora beticola]|uniref:Uncharacterized protein n=2 Tax=Cercospora beticola TaxID=122368 RepID=A0A2G5HFD1_CERBT|nr:hypothetical protein CB0940_10882 [Cercospora beticola]PIA90943.1 hypothetical protein CB0940_10882 [Cercospora beticola]
MVMQKSLSFYVMKLVNAAPMLQESMLAMSIFILARYCFQNKLLQFQLKAGFATSSSLNTVAGATVASPVTVAVTGTAPAPATTSFAEVIGGKSIEALAFSAIRLPKSPLSLARSAGQNVHIANPVAAPTDNSIRKPADLISSLILCLSFFRAATCSANKREALTSLFLARSTNLAIRLLCLLVSARSALPTASALESQAGPTFSRLKAVLVAGPAVFVSPRVGGVFCNNLSIGTGYGSISLVLINFKFGLCSNRWSFEILLKCCVSREFERAPSWNRMLARELEVVEKARVAFWREVASVELNKVPAMIAGVSMKVKKASTREGRGNEVGVCKARRERLIARDAG